MTETTTTPMVLKEENGKTLILLSAQQHYSATDITTANVTDEHVDLLYVSNASEEDGRNVVKTFPLADDEMNLLCAFWTERQAKIQAEKEAAEKAEQEAIEKAHELVTQYPDITIVDEGERYDVRIEKYSWTSAAWAYSGEELLNWVKEAVEYYTERQERELVKAAAHHGHANGGC